MEEIQEKSFSQKEDKTTIKNSIICTSKTHDLRCENLCLNINAAFTKIFKKEDEHYQITVSNKPQTSSNNFSNVLFSEDF
mmetsp:Transcript_9378/g.8284  ORF Transcript_9378/g.8284 Transcript_9378/m.8284 type:complete len:80 (+) Transcript_9378:32-271(+)